MNNVVIDVGARGNENGIGGRVRIGRRNDVENLVAADVGSRIKSQNAVGGVFDNVSLNGGAAIYGRARIIPDAAVQNGIFDAASAGAVIKGDPADRVLVAAGLRILNGPVMDVHILNGDVRSAIHRNTGSRRPMIGGVHQFILDFKIIESDVVNQAGQHGSECPDRAAQVEYRPAPGSAVEPGGIHSKINRVSRRSGDINNEGENEFIPRVATLEYHSITGLQLDQVAVAETPVHSRRVLPRRTLGNAVVPVRA